MLTVWRYTYGMAEFFSLLQKLASVAAETTSWQVHLHNTLLVFHPQWTSTLSQRAILQNALDEHLFE